MIHLLHIFPFFRIFSQPAPGVPHGSSPRAGCEETRSHTQKCIERGKRKYQKKAQKFKQAKSKVYYEQKDKDPQTLLNRRLKGPIELEMILTEDQRNIQKNYLMSPHSKNDHSMDSKSDSNLHSNLSLPCSRPHRVAPGIFLGLRVHQEAIYLMDKNIILT